jgi:hypothetical protein
MGTTDQRIARFAQAIIDSCLHYESEAGIVYCVHCRINEEFPVDEMLFKHKPDCVALEAIKFLV